MNSHKDIVVASLRYAREKFLIGQMVSKAEFSNFLVRDGYIKPQEVDTHRHLITALYEQIFSFQDPAFTVPTRFMGLDSYIGLLDHEELELAKKDSALAREEAQQAINNAKEATMLTERALFWTKVSVIVATIVGLAQIAVAFY